MGIRPVEPGDTEAVGDVFLAALAGARRFYERTGFALVELTDGSRNVEREPDALDVWKPGS